MLCLRKYFKLSLYFFITMALLALFVNEAEAQKRRPREKKVKYVKPKGWLGHLMQISRQRDDMQKELKNETKAYESVRKAVDRRELRAGEAASKIEKEYGRPVIKLSENDNVHTRWVYKPGDATYFTGEKICLFFDGEDKLEKWEFVEKKPDQNEGENS